MFLLGDTFLRHIYQVYNYEKNSVSLAVDKHSELIARMYERDRSHDVMVYCLCMLAVVVLGVLASVPIAMYLRKKKRSRMGISGSGKFVSHSGGV